MADDDDDNGVVELMQWLFSLSPNQANKFQHYSTGGHGVDMFAAHRELPVMITDWFGTTLKVKQIALPTHVPAPVTRESNFLELIDHPDGPSKAAQLFAEARQRDPKAVLFSEAILNRVGYERLQSGDIKGVSRS